jgi:predicted transcriptional regulator
MAEEEYALFQLDEAAAQKHRFSLRRSHLEIRMDILSCIKSGAEKPTQVMYKANLSWSALQEHLTALQQGGLLKEVEYRTRRRYELTEKAVAVLLAYNKILQDISAPFQKPQATF